MYIRHVGSVDERNRRKNHENMNKDVWSLAWDIFNSPAKELPV